MSQLVARTIEGLVGALGALPTAPRLVGIDGVTLAGKSTLAGRLAEQMHATHLDLDDFIEGNRRGFVEFLRVPSLLAAISRAPGAVILSGICMLAVQQEAQLSGAFQVYLRRITPTGWIDGEEMYGDLLDEIAAACGKQPADYVPTFEVREYHRRFRPDERADVIFERLE